MNQKASPSAYPGSFQDQGAYWANLTTAYTIFGDTLTVQLSDAHSGGCVIADAIRVIQVTTPEISVWDGGASLTSGASQVNLGETVLNTPLPRQFLIRNEGGASLSLGTITLPPGYSLVQGLGSATLLPGQSTTFAVQLDATAPGTFSGRITVGNNDNNEAPFSFGITGTVGNVYAPTAPPVGSPPAPPPVAAPVSVVLLDGSNVLYPALSVVDYGTTSLGQGVTRTFTILNPVTATSGVTLGTVGVPAGFTAVYAGAGTVLAPGQSLTFQLTLNAASAGTFAGNVTVSGTGGDLPFAFAVAGLVTAGLPPLTAPLYVDNGTSGVGGYTATGGFAAKTGTGYLGDYAMATGDASGDYAQWQFTNLPAGTFSVATSYYQRSTRTAAAQYTVTWVNPSGVTQNAIYSINQQLAANDIYDQSTWWERLGGSFQVQNASTLTVRLSDQGGAALTVVGDAVRVEQQTRPEITVRDGSVELTSGSSLVDFGSTVLGAPVSRTITVRNDGGGPLQLPASIVVPGGFSLTAPFGSTLLASGQATTFSIRLDAATSGTFSGPISFQNNDADESPFQFTIQGSVTLGIPMLTEPVYVDNGDPAYTATAGFSNRSGTGYLGDYALADGDASGDYAQWQFTNLPAGTFSVATSYYQRSTRTAAAQYTVTWVDPPGVTRNQTFSIDQRAAANDFSDRGLWWERLGVSFQVRSGSTLTVRLSDQGGATVTGDAVRVEQLSPLLAEASASGAAGGELTTLDAVPSPLVQQAAARWSAVDPQYASRLANVEVIVADLPGQTLGLASAWTQTIWLDVDAAGWAWSTVSGLGSFVKGHSSVVRGPGDGTPSSFDLLTVIAHELGHVLGLGTPTSSDDVMADTLSAGVRRLPQPQLDGRGDLFRPGLLTSPGTAAGDRELARGLAIGDWGTVLGKEFDGGNGLFARRGSVRLGPTDDAATDAAEAALLAWSGGRPGGKEDDAQILVGLRRDGEDEHSNRVDRLFEASDDWGVGPLAWQTEDRPGHGGRR